MSAISDLNNTVFFIDHGEIKHETKGLWTWIKAHWINPKDYKLAAISQLALADIEKYKKLIPDINVKIAKYNSLHKDTPIKEIPPFGELIPLSQRRETIGLTILAAASKGEALGAATRAIESVTQKQPVIESKGDSTQKVFLLPEEGAVFKHADAQASEEERNINDLFDLMSGQATVGTFTIKSTSRQAFGMTLPEDVKKRGYAVEDMQPALKKAIKAGLSTKDASLLSTQKTTKKSAEDRPEKTEMWWVQQPGEEKGQEVSFAELQKLYRQEKLSPKTLVGESEDEAEPMSDQDDSFFEELNYSPSQQADSEGFYLVPDLKDPSDRKAYELCEGFKWTFKDKKNKEHQVDFKTLHALYLKNAKIHDVACVPSENLAFPEQKDLDKALIVSWTVVGSTIMQKEKTVISPLSGVQSKPYVGMELMRSLTDKGKEAVLGRLSPESEFNAVLTGEVQLLDLYDGNLGVAPIHNKEYERFKELKFSMSASGPTSRSFDALLKAYMQGQITKESTIKIVENGKTVTTKIKEFPELLQALEMRWQVVIFDTDLSLAESNQLSLQFRGGIKGHLIPLRSVLLETSWKDKPLSSQAVERLQKSDERDLRVKRWAKKEDAPIYKRLSKETRESVTEKIAPFIEKYTLSESREHRRGNTLRNIRDRFVGEVASAVPDVWKLIQDDLSYVTVRDGDTWEKIAERHNQDVESLKKLNPGVSDPGSLEGGKKVKIDYDLTSQKDIAVLRREKIAVQLFPRITNRQQQALFERQSSRRDYLNSYQALQQGKLSFEEIKLFVQSPTAPLTSIRRDEFLQEMDRTKDSAHVRELLLKECKPTYFNLMKVMYPLLADAYALNQVLYTTKEAGANVGLYEKPLEEIIKEAKTKSLSSDHKKLIINLERQIKDLKDPTFFGHWG